MKDSKYIDAFIQRLRSIPPGTVIPKPEAQANFVVKGWGKRADEDALIYFIPNHSNPAKPYQKESPLRNGPSPTKNWLLNRNSPANGLTPS